MQTNYFAQYFQENWLASSSQIEQLEKFANFIFTENTKFNITGHKTLEKILKDLIIGGIVPFENMKDMLTSCTNILDIGTGAGIPGIILKILFPTKNITLMEANTKKCQFLEMIINQLSLTDIFILHQRAEAVNPKFKNHFDFITARALASIATCLQWMYPYLKKNGKIVLPKSFHSQDEYNDSLSTMKKLHLSLMKIEMNTDDLFNYHTYIFQKS